MPDFSISSPQTPLAAQQGNSQSQSLLDLSTQTKSLGSGGSLGQLTTFSVNPLYKSPRDELHTQLRHTTSLKSKMVQLQTRLTQAWQDMDSSDSEPEGGYGLLEQPTPVAPWFPSEASKKGAAEHRPSGSTPDLAARTDSASLGASTAGTTGQSPLGARHGHQVQPTARASRSESPVNVQELLKELSLHSVPSEQEGGAKPEESRQARQGGPGDGTPSRASRAGPTTLDLQQLSEELSSATKENIYLRTQVSSMRKAKRSQAQALPLKDSPVLFKNSPGVAVQEARPAVRAPLAPLNLYGNFAVAGSSAAAASAASMSAARDLQTAEPCGREAGKHAPAAGGGRMLSSGHAEEGNKADREGLRPMELDSGKAQDLSEAATSSSRITRSRPAAGVSSCTHTPADAHKAGSCEEGSGGDPGSVNRLAQQLHSRTVALGSELQQSRHFLEAELLLTESRMQEMYNRISSTRRPQSATPEPHTKPQDIPARGERLAALERQLAEAVREQRVLTRRLQEMAARLAEREAQLAAAQRELEGSRRAGGAALERSRAQLAEFGRQLSVAQVEVADCRVRAQQASDELAVKVAELAQCRAELQASQQQNRELLGQLHKASSSRAVPPDTPSSTTPQGPSEAAAMTAAAAADRPHGPPRSSGPSHSGATRTPAAAEKRGGGFGLLGSLFVSRFAHHTPLTPMEATPGSPHWGASSPSSASLPGTASSQPDGAERSNVASVPDAHISPATQELARALAGIRARESSETSNGSRSRARNSMDRPQSMAMADVFLRLRDSGSPLPRALQHLEQVQSASSGRET